MIVVTGGAGFIGSNLVYGLNRIGERDILVVDDLKNGLKHRNLNALKISDYRDRYAFLEKDWYRRLRNVKAIFHMGACSNTMEYDGHYMMNNNYEYSKALLAWAQKERIPFIYASSASVYGNGENGFSEKAECEFPLNVYAYSKYLFDQRVRTVLSKKRRSPIVGLRFFNVYGPQENHKGKMASVVYHFFHQIRQSQSFNLFEGSLNYKRDFVAVGDVVKMMLHFYRRPDLSGIFNAGTGRAESFEAIAEILEKRFPGVKKGYTPFPPELKEKYQKFTQADLENLRTAGEYHEPFQSLEQGVVAYVETLTARNGYLI